MNRLPKTLDLSSLDYLEQRHLDALSAVAAALDRAVRQCSDFSTDVEAQAVLLRRLAGLIEHGVTVESSADLAAVAARQIADLMARRAREHAAAGAVRRLATPESHGDISRRLLASRGC